MYYFIANPHSGNGRGYKICRQVERQLGNACVEYELFLVREPGEAREIARKLTEGCKDPRIIVAVGGDGTVNEVLDGICFCGTVTMGYIPSGRGNDLARSLKMPSSSSRCLKKILYPKYHKMLDYGVISYGEDEILHRRFAVSAGIGLDASVCHSLLHQGVKRLYLGKLNYILTGMKQFLLARPVKGYILLDGVQKVEFNHIYFISAHIHPYEGGGFRFAPQANCMDGKLTICVAHHSGKWKLLSFLVNALTRKQRKYRGVRNFDCREVSIHMDRPMAVHADGESCLMQTDIQMRCIQKKLRMMV
ncbi:diacylglycerol kinase family protein [Clostridium sp. AM58-1XD]|uniref:diacylglycerol/lipid kinase family protein n=1 Tax=Clostridium sp. AM58-1XD TaxID=2292307 RepID=UPI000E4B9823|nr:diacylglycerol kinase family protein [Clostridium sp. AM58-1XD]RGY98412.1 diacylglycerol kinase family lipid kinase [Clostridium sp. AM58-1XD]